VKLHAGTRTTLAWPFWLATFGCCAAGLAWSWTLPFDPWISRLLRDQRPRPPVAQLVTVVGDFSWAPAVAMGVTLPALLLPDGRLRSRRWRSWPAAWTRCRPSCWLSSSRPWRRPGLHSGCGRRQSKAAAVAPPPRASDDARPSTLGWAPRCRDGPGAEGRLVREQFAAEGSRRTMASVTAERFLNTHHHASPPPSPDVPEDLASFVLAADRVPAEAAELAGALARAQHGAAMQRLGEGWAHARTSSPCKRSGSLRGSRCGG
jgi:hypothetical protein